MCTFSKGSTLPPQLSALQTKHYLKAQLLPLLADFVAGRVNTSIPLADVGDPPGIILALW